MSPPANSLWDFACALYRRPKVAPLCLCLQDDYSLNVNLVLWCVWLATQGLQLTEARLQQAQQLIAEWDSRYTQQLRRLRRQLKIEAPVFDLLEAELYTQIKCAELLTEQKTLALLESLARTWLIAGAASLACTDKNLNVYLAPAQLPVAVWQEVKQYLC
jgi:uncharacterized protein (TIGR02444 family)